MVGGAGNDTYIVDSTSDTITDSAGIDTVKSRVSFNLGGSIKNLVLLGSAAVGTGNGLNNSIRGSAGNNTLLGGAGNDILEGGGGADRLIGESGDDTYIVSTYTDVLVETADAAGGIDTVASSVSWDLSARPDCINIENLTLLGSGVIDGTGSSLNNLITGNASRNTLRGLAGNDTLVSGGGGDLMDGGTGNDTYVVSSADDLIVEAETSSTQIDTVRSSISWTLSSQNIENIELLGTAALTATGNSRDNLLKGNTGNNLLSGQLGNDTLLGENGNDTILGGAGDDQLVGGAGLDSLVGGSGNDNLEGGLGNDTLDGGLGADSMIGGLGADLYVVDSALDVVTEDLEVSPAARDTVQASISYSLGANIENLVLAESLLINGVGNTLANTITGNSLRNTLLGLADNDTINGLAGDDVIEGGEGDDILDGGLGVDTASYASATSVLPFGVSVNLSTAGSQNTGLAGFDTLIGFENLVGSSLNDVLTGDSSNNILEGGAGNDTLNGGIGTDTASYISASSAVTVSLTSASGSSSGGAGVDVLNGFENILGSQFNDSLLGNETNNVLEGAAGNDTLNGGLGTDTASYASATAAVAVTLTTGGGTASGGAGADNLISIENILGSAFNDTLTGNAADNVIEGGAGNDTINGGNGVDTVSYASALSATRTGVSVNLAVTTGQETGVSGRDTITNAENLLGSAFDDVLTGNGLANQLDGGLGNDRLDGGLGNDTLTGGLGIDTAAFTSATSGVSASLLSGTSTSAGNNDTLIGIENLVGSAFADVLIGTSQANTLDGREGLDTLTGGAGADLFRFTTAGGSGNVDLITDFATGSDKLVFSRAAFSALGSGSSLTASQFISGAGVVAATTADQRLIYNATTGALLFDSDGNGAGAAFQVAKLGTSTAPVLTFTDIQLTA